MNLNLTGLDIGVFVIYLLAVLVLGVVAARRGSPVGSDRVRIVVFTGRRCD